MLGGGGGALRFGRVVSGSLRITELKGLFDTLVLDSTLDLTFSRNWFDAGVGFAGVFLVWLADKGLDVFRWLLIRASFLLLSTTCLSPPVLGLMYVNENVVPRWS